MGAQETPGSVVKLSKKGIDFSLLWVYNKYVIKGRKPITKDKWGRSTEKSKIFFEKSLKKLLTNLFDYDII